MPQSTTQAAKPKVDERQIASIVKPKKEPELRVTFTGPELADYFPKAAPTVAEVKRTVFEALDLRKKALERQAKKQEIKDAAKSRHSRETADERFGCGAGFCAL